MRSVWQWEYKLHKRKEAFWTKTKNKGLASKYGEWLSGDKLVFPRHLQQKFIPNEPPAQTKLREKGVLKDFEMQIELYKMRADEQRERVHEIDNKCCKNLKTGLVVKWQKCLKNGGLHNAFIMKTFRIKDGKRMTDGFNNTKKILFSLMKTKTHILKQTTPIKTMTLTLTPKITRMKTGEDNQPPPTKITEGHQPQEQRTGTECHHGSPINKKELLITFPTETILDLQTDFKNCRLHLKMTQTIF